MFGEVFSEEQWFDAKVFLRSHANAIECIKQAAEKSQSTHKYEKMMDIIIKGKTQGAEESMKQTKEYKLFQFSNFIFKKYFPQFDTYDGEYPTFKNIITEGVQKMKDDINQVPENKTQQ